MSNKNHKYKYVCKRKPQHEVEERDLVEMLTKVSELLDAHPELVGAQSVKRRIEMIRQPRGGYIRPSQFDRILLGDGIDKLNPKENITPGIIGSTVDYLTRFLTGTTVESAFSISRRGARNVGGLELFNRLLLQIRGLDDNSIIAAVHLSGFDIAYRAPEYYKPVEYLDPDEPTIENIKTMVERSLKFFEQYGPVIVSNLTFEGGYTKYIGSGDGDFLTRDTLWDFKVSKNEPQSKHTLQLLIYWRMGVHSTHRKQYNSIKYLGIYNPRQNIVYRLEVDQIPEETITAVDSEVIGYNLTDSADDNS